FLIHADFVTEASRQDIDTTSQRNLDLLNGIADTFIVAIEHFVNDSQLKYSCLKYFPEFKDSFPWGSFWSAMIEKINEKLQSKAFLLGENDSRRRISESRICEDNFLSKGVPLLADISPECYLSSGYDREDLQKLGYIGLRSITVNEVIARAKTKR
ncbi:hypothetical protein HK405_004248, partial [Cladochytrium tenue]